MAVLYRSPQIYKFVSILITSERVLFLSVPMPL